MNSSKKLANKTKWKIQNSETSFTMDIWNVILLFTNWEDMTFTLIDHYGFFQFFSNLITSNFFLLSLIQRDLYLNALNDIPNLNVSYQIYALSRLMQNKNSKYGYSTFTTHLFTNNIFSTIVSYQALISLFLNKITNNVDNNRNPSQHSYSIKQVWSLSEPIKLFFTKLIMLYPPYVLHRIANKKTLHFYHTKSDGFHENKQFYLYPDPTGAYNRKYCREFIENEQSVDWWFVYCVDEGYRDSYIEEWGFFIEKPFQFSFGCRCDGDNEVTAYWIDEENPSSKLILMNDFTAVNINKMKLLFTKYPISIHDQGIFYWVMNSAAKSYVHYPFDLTASYPFLDQNQNVTGELGICFPWKRSWINLFEPLRAIEIKTYNKFQLKIEKIVNEIKLFIRKNTSILINPKLHGEIISFLDLIKLKTKSTNRKSKVLKQAIERCLRRMVNTLLEQYLTLSQDRNNNLEYATKEMIKKCKEYHFWGTRSEFNVSNSYPSRWPLLLLNVALKWIKIIKQCIKYDVRNNFNPQYEQTNNENIENINNKLQQYGLCIDIKSATKSISQSITLNDKNMK